MNRRDFLSGIEKGLAGLPREDVESRLAFYSEMIDDRVEDGLSEEEAVAAAGSPDEIVRQIVADYPLNRLVREKIKPDRARKGWEIALIVLGFPVWLPLMISAFAVMLSLYICVWAVVVSLWAVEAALFVCALAGCAAAVMFLIRGFALQAAAAFGAGVFTAGFSILFFFFCRAVTKGVLHLTKRAVFSVKSKFAGKGNAQ
ncbi:MAG: DUF1700 domain-containing protein [Clostridia bacterium]|nr:DUF1700 domain-containing protein [Clostridia bacterium]